MQPPVGPSAWACKHYDPETSCCKFWGTHIGGDSCPACNEFAWRNPWIQHLSERVQALEDSQQDTDAVLRDLCGRECMV